MLLAPAKKPTALKHLRLALRLGLPTAACLGALVMTRPAAAVPSFADQTGQPCQACHVGGFGPQLTQFGREFKLNGYTMRGAKKFNVPLSAMAIASYTHTKTDQVPAPDNLSPNDNVTFDQGSVFLGGGVGKHFGGLAQLTYDGIGKAWTWDNVDLRAVTQGKVFGKDATFGIDFNNNPTVQDPWNTTAGWGFPYTGGAVAQTPGASPLIDGGLAEEVVGMTAYAWIDHHIYLEAGGYSSPKARTLQWLGSDPVGLGDIHGLAPYGRVAWTHEIGSGQLELGAFALKAAINPGRDRSSGLTDHYSDVGIDASYMLPTAKGDTFTVQARYVHESENLMASCALNEMPVGCADTHLRELRGDIAYSYRGKLGLTLAAFSVTGPPNTFIYTGPLARPDSNGVTAQIDYTPWGAGNGPLGPLVALRVGAQFTAYGQFNGNRRDFDGNGAAASDNNALRLFTWIAF
ncbi:hypothetical protein [Novosphingobium sp.]|uniref:hypothetical protein n=1 Tax=Novosphingobium sp. TaxID=1874826 RepID=UPI003340138D